MTTEAQERETQEAFEPAATPEPDSPNDQAETPDYKALFEEANARAEKAEQRARSFDGQVRKQQERDAAIDTAVREAKKARQYMELMLEHQSNGETDPEEFRRKLGEISAEDARAEYVQVQQEMRDDLVALMEASGLTMNDDVIVEADKLWQEGIQSPSGISKLIKVGKMVKAAADDKIRATHEAALKTAREEGEREGRQRARRAEDTDLSLPRGGGSTQSDEGVWAAYGRGEIQWSSRVAEAGRKVGAL